LGGCYARCPHHVKRVGSRIRVESEEVAVAGWDASARLLGVVRYRDAGDVDGALGALVRAYLNAGAACVGLGGALTGERPSANDTELGGITERATAAVSAIADPP
jgi:2-keto-3-deoxy-6-phosphogluconate aldolase